MITPPFSRTHRAVLVVGIVCLLTSFASIVFVGARNDNAEISATTAAPTANASTKARIAERFGKLPLSFEINKGQSDQSVKFLSHGTGYDLFLTATDAVLTLRKPQTARTDNKSEAEVREGSVIRLRMIGANPTPQIEGRDELPGKVNYFIGNNSDKWRRNIPTYRRVYYTNVYPGIDMVYYGNQRELEYDFVVAPGANPKSIRFKVDGAERLRLDKTGDLLLTLQHGEVRLHKPLLYQLTEEGNRREVKGEYVINGNEIRFKVQSFDSGKQLVIDPVLSYATFLGGSTGDQGFGIAVDSQGNAYITGRAAISGFPTTPGAFKTTSNSGGAFVTKLNPTGTNLVYSTFLTGSDGNSNGTAIAVDAAGNAHVTGSTDADDFPIVNALKTTSNFFKTTDAAANWNNNNTGLVGDVGAIAVARNAPNIIYAHVPGGVHRSTDAGANWTKPQNAGLTPVGFLTAMAVDPTNSSVVYLCTNNGLFKTSDGGDNWSVVSGLPSFSGVFSIVFDPVTPSTIYVGANNGVFKSTDSGATWTAQTNFGIPSAPNVRPLAIDPTTPTTLYAGTFNNGLFKTTNGGTSWTAMNSGMGGDSPNNIVAIAIDPSNPSTIYTGHGSNGGINKSTNGGTSWGPVNSGVPSLPVTALLATSTAVYAAIDDRGVIKTTNGGTTWVGTNAGLGSSRVRALVGHPSDVATLYAGTSPSISDDAFVTKLNASGSGLLFSTLLGGSRGETGNDIALDSTGNIHVVGRTGSTNFPVVNAIQSTHSPAAGNCTDGFVTKINPAVPSYVFSTYLGGDGCGDNAFGVATDAAGNVYVTGATSSTNFPIANAFQSTLGSGQFNSDAFVTKLTTGGSLSYSTYLGGNGSDTGHAIAVDVSGNAYITGVTGSTNFPTQNPIQQLTSPGANEDVFVTKLNAAGNGLVYSTYLGGSNTDIGRGIAIDSAGNAVVTGSTKSVEFPLTAGSLRTKSAIYKSIDGGAIWTNDNSRLPAHALTLAIHPTLPSTLYAGTLSGVFKSTNGGRNWSLSNNGIGNVPVNKVLIDPLTPSTIYALANSHNGDDGVYKSTDGGNNWNLRVNGMGSKFLLSLAIDPVTPNILYAGFLGGPGGHIYKTTDGADNWVPTGNDALAFPVSLAVDPHNHTTVYATESSSGGGVLKSVDSGATWQSVGFSQTGPHGSFVTVSPHTPGLLYAVTSGGLFKSVDGGDNWSLIPSRFGIIVFDPVSPTTVYLLSTNDGIFKSTDNGQTWTAINKGLEFEVVQALAIDPLMPSTLHLVSISSGAFEAFVTKINTAGSALIYSTLIGGTSPSPNAPEASAEGSAIAIDSAGSVYITGTATAEVPFTTPNTFQPIMRGASDAFIAKLINSYIISGHVRDGSSAPVSGADVVLSDGGSLTAVVTESDGSYEFSGLREGGNFTVIATKPHFTMAPTSQTFNNLSSDQTLNFTATATNAAFHTISGQVTNNGVGLAGVSVALSGSHPGLRTTDSNGNYSFELAAGGNYTVTPSILGFTFGPSSQTFNNLSAPQTANFAATRQNFVVTNNNNHGTGSLRDAIVNANATVGLDTITFNIPGPGVKVINLVNVLPEITDPVVIDATTQPGYAGTPLIELNGSAIGGFFDGAISIRAGGTTVRGLAIGRFTAALTAIFIRDCNNNVIQGNHLGVDAAGTVARPNPRGILMFNSSNNLIGGTTAAARNVISGNTSEGMEIQGSNNVIQGNFIGTNAAGTEAIQNSSGVSISVPSSINNVIGGTAPGAGNLISGNTQRGIAANTAGTVIQGNLIGTDVTGTRKIPNGNGIEAAAENVLIGGLTASARNIISGNDGDGVSFGGDGSKVQGNYIGTDITGTLPLGNGSSGVGAGTNALIGGTVPEARNVIAANGVGITLRFAGVTSSSIVQGNYIGTDVTGNRALGNTFVGIAIHGANCLVGGVVPGAGNVISGNPIGVEIGLIFQNGSDGNTVQGNLIGLNALGTAPLPNTFRGINVVDSNSTTIGGTQSGEANTIAFNSGPGVLVTSGTGNSIRGNAIFSNAGLGIDLGGVTFPTGANGVTANDPNDADNGPNNLQNFPLLTSVTSVGSNTTIQGNLNSTPNTTFQIDFYTSSALDPTGNGEGAQFLNSTAVTTDGNGNATINASFPVALGAGRVVTATATDPNGNTSEFSAGDATGAKGNVQFSVSEVQVIEDIGLMTVTVVRTGGAAGALTVDYATTDGTAVAGQDYTATSGTLTFSGGETTKTFQIPITDDAPTETDETFTVTLRNTSSIDSLGVPNTLIVTIQDRTTVPVLSIVTLTTVVEGGPGTTAQMLFNVSLSAATGRTVTVNFSTSNIVAFGGVTCNTRGVDYVTSSGTATVQPGNTSVTIPITVCGDTNAEATEGFNVSLTNPVNATLSNNLAVGAISNDDVLELVLEESGPVAGQAGALDALLLVRDPFRIVGIPEWWPTTTDRNTRVTLFARNLELNPGESPSAVIVRISGTNPLFIDVPAEAVQPIHNFELTEVVFKLPDNVQVGTRTVTIRAHGRISNAGTIRIVQ